MGHSQTHGYLFGLGAVLIWSGFILVSRLGGLSDLNHYDVIALRYGTCAVIVLPVWWFKFRFNLWQFKYLAVALVGGMAYALTTFHGFQLAPASHGALLLPGSMPLFIFVLALLAGQSSWSVQKMLGVMVITVGIGALFYGQFLSAHVDINIIKGDGLFLLGALSWGVFSVMIKHWGVSPWQATISIAILTALMYLPMYVLFAPKQISQEVMPDILTQMVYQGFLATIVQLLLFVRAVELIGAANMGSLMAFVPLIAGVSALIIFNEPVTATLVLGLMLVAFGAWFSHSRLIEKMFHKPIL